jgi:hypothetical protein
MSRFSELFRDSISQKQKNLARPAGNKSFFTDQRKLL